MLRLFTAATALALACAAPAHAQWLHQKGEDDPFKGGAEQFAMSISVTGQMAVFRCATSDDLQLMLVTIEAPTDMATLMLAMSKARLLVVVDNDQKMALPAEVEITPDQQRYRVAASGVAVRDVLLRVATAKQRFALAGEVADKVVWSQTFGVQNSKRAVQPLIDGCKVTPSG